MKRSGANSRLPENLTFFIDRSLRSVVIKKALVDLGLRVVVLDEIYPQDIDDETWIEKVGKEGWIGLTKDKDIRQRYSVFSILFKHKARLFVLTSQGMKGAEQAQCFVKAMPKMLRFISNNKAPFIVAVSASGNLSKIDVKGRIKAWESFHAKRDN